MTGMLESAEAARRLGVKLPTLYAYVSRGLLVSHPAPGGRRSLFAAEDVEALAKRSRGGRTTETRLATVTTSTTQLRDDGPVYRGTPATELATTVPYEEAAELLWRGEPAEARRLGALRPATARRPSARRTACAGPWSWPVPVTPCAPTCAPRRSSPWPGAWWRRWSRSFPVPVTAPAPPAPAPAPTRAGARTRARRQPLGAHRGGGADGTARPGARRRLVRAVNAALILLADHELATSTVAVRVAASARANLYDALLAGLGVVAGPLHGGASQLAYGLMRDAEELGPERALDETLRWQHRLPGFGHSVYRGTDPRFTVLKAWWTTCGRPTVARSWTRCWRWPPIVPSPGPTSTWGSAP